MSSLISRIGLFVFVLLVLSSVTWSQTRKITVGINISADERIKSQIESFIKSELRQIDDVDIYASNPKFQIQIVAIDPDSTIVLSVVVTENYDFTPTIESTLARSNVTAKAKDSLVELLAKRESIVHHSIISRSESLLRELCRAAVASIDTNVFESLRNSRAFFDRLEEKYELNKVEKAPELPRTTTKPVTSGAPVFEKEFLGGDSVTVVVKNDTNRILTLSFGGVLYVLQPQMSREIVADGGRYEFSATAPSARPKTGVQEFAKGYRYTWRFFIVRR